jgi:hypothetical protein
LAPRPLHLLLGLLIFIGALANAIPLTPATAAPGPASYLPLPQPSFQSTTENEIADLVVVPIDPGWDGSQLLRSRPLILNWNLNPAFALGPTGAILDETQARNELAAFLTLRGLPAMNVQAVLARFDDPDVVNVIAAPAIRAALLMLSGLEPYQAVIDSLIGGKNETGLPFAAVEFADLGIANAVAMIHPPSAQTGGRFLMQIASVFANEPPLQLLPAIIHESMHGDGENSGPEELAANILDTVAYGELLLIDPSAAYDGTQLTAYNNLQLYALLNSMGARGGGQIGINTSATGDIFVGPGLEAFDARSIRASILQDPFYGALGSNASAISPVASALLKRISGETSLGAFPVFDEALLALLDRGISQIITPDAALSLALTLGLNATAGSAEIQSTLRPATLLDLEARPFVPVRASLFDMNTSRRPASTTDERTMRLALSESLAAHASTTLVRSQSLALFDDAAFAASYPDNQLRAALALLTAIDPWAPLVESVIAQESDAVTWRIEFAPLPLPINAMFAPSLTGNPGVRINDYLIGDSLEVTASAIIEGILLESDRRTPNTTTIAALMSTMAYAAMVDDLPSIASKPTWGTISRNIDLLALLNSAPWSSSVESMAPEEIGFLAAAPGVTDVLPGLVQDAGSFQAYVLNSARADGVDAVTLSIPSKLLLDVAESSGAPLPQGAGGAVIDQVAMLQLDGRVSKLMAPEMTASVLAALGLGVSL